MPTFIIVTELIERTAYRVEADSLEAAEDVFEEEGYGEYPVEWSRTLDHQIVASGLSDDKDEDAIA